MGQSNATPFQALILSGWGHTPEGFDIILPPGIEAMPFPYHHLQDKEAVLSALRQQNLQPDLVIGWSLGGRLAVHAIAQGIIAPKLFVLLAAAFSTPSTVNKNQTTGLLDSYQTAPEETRIKFINLMVQGDDRADYIRAHVSIDKRHDADWVRWLDARLFGCEDLDFSTMPRTLIIHGANDAVTSHHASELFHQHISNSALTLLPDCGHVPHLHAPEEIAKLIGEEIEYISRQELDRAGGSR